MSKLQMVKKWGMGLSCLVSFMAFMLFTLCAQAEDLPQKETIYGLDSRVQEQISIPDDMPQSYQIAGGNQNTYRIVRGDSARVSADGLVTPQYTYWKQNSSYSTSVSEGEDYDYYTLNSGDTVIEVTNGDKSYSVTVNVRNYASIYCDEVMDNYLKENITDTMTDREIIEAITRFPASYEYSASYSSVNSMIIYGGGDCWASTDAIITLCEKLEIKSWIRIANKDLGAGAGHRNAMAELNGVYYELEAGYSSDKKDGYRPYDVTVRESLVSSYITDSDEVVVYQYDGYDSKGTLEIPEMIGGRPVTKIASSAFVGRSFSEVKLPDTLTVIGDSAFSSCRNLTRVEIPSSVTVIGQSAFSGCEKLESISVAEGNTEYKEQDQVLYSKDGSTLVMCPAAGEVTIPSSVTKIADYAFYKNENLTRIVIPESVTDIGERAFGICIGLSDIVFEGEGLMRIGKYCFYSDIALSVLKLPSSVKTIGSYAFSGCSHLQCLYFMGDAPEFGETTDGTVCDQVFKGCNINACYIEGNDTWTSEVLGNYGGTVQWLPWSGTEGKSIEHAVLTLEEGLYSYTESDITPAVTLTLDGAVLTEEKDYVVIYMNNKNAGTAEVTAAGIGPYYGTVSASFTIGKAEPEFSAYAFPDQIMEGDTAQIYGDYVYGKFEYTYVSSNPSVAVVDNLGKVKGVAAGCTDITVTQKETNNYMAASVTVSITVTHDFSKKDVVDTVVENGCVQVKCDRCSQACSVTVPTDYRMYWLRDGQYCYVDFDKEFQVGDYLECSCYDTSNAELGEMEIVSQDSSIVAVVDNKRLEFVANGTTQVSVRPKYNPAIGKTFTVYVGMKKPGEDEPGGEKPGEGEPGSEKPGEGEPGNEKPGEGEPGNEKPGEGEPGNEKPGEDEPGNEKPGESEPGNEKPGEGNPGNEKPGEDEPGNEKPGEGNPGSEKPGEGEPGNEKPGEGNPGSEKPGTGAQTDMRGMKYYDRSSGLTVILDKMGKKEVALSAVDERHAKGRLIIPNTMKVKGEVYKITSIEKNVLRNRKQLKEVVIGKYVKNIGSSAFYGCDKLQSVTMGKKVTTIGKNAFYKCKKLKKITIPSGVCKIDKNAFYGCKNLKNITIQSKKLTSKNVGSNAFKGIYSKAVIKVPKSKLAAYNKMLKIRGVGAKVKIKR